MNTKIITAIVLACVMCSCSSMYKATSTPDDVYYSPSPSVKVKDGGGNDQYEDYVSSNDDRYLRMKVQNRSLWSGIDDYSYWQDSRYDFGYSCNSSRFALMNSFYNPYGYNYYSAFNPGFGLGLGYGYYGFGGGGGYWNSPYQTIVLYKNPRTYFGGTTNKSNLTAYRNIQYNNGAGYKANGYNNNNGFVNGNTNTRNNTYNNTNTNSSQPARSFNAGSSNNNAGGRSGGYSSAGSSAPASRPTRH
jgi:hypothetical protein